MKTTNLILILMAVLSLMSCGQLHVVTLYVDTTNINQSNIDQYASFGQSSVIPNKHFITNVRKGDKVIWQGVSITDPSHMVTISAIEHESGDYILKQNNGVITKSVISPLVFGKIKIVTKPARGRSFAEEKYRLKFEISNQPGTLVIDPKIRSQ